jgi:hypothetical protein
MQKAIQWLTTGSELVVNARRLDQAGIDWLKGLSLGVTVTTSDEKCPMWAQ